MYKKDMEKQKATRPLQTGVLEENDLYTWAISDTHFFHNNIVGYAGRPEFPPPIGDEIPVVDLYYHNTLMFKNWDAKIGEGDRILHLGDLAFGPVERLDELDLPGQKTLLLGNHDRRNPRRYKEIGFRVIKKGFSVPWKGWTILFVHDPSHAPELYPKHIVVHGHIHEKNYGDPRFINLSVEQIDYSPVWLPDVLNAKIEELTE